MIGSDNRAWTEDSTVEESAPRSVIDGSFLRAGGDPPEPPRTRGCYPICLTAQ
jgi:hypothetical protein